MFAMHILLVIIEKIGDEYAAYTPNMTGVKVTSPSREEVEREIITAIEHRLEVLQSPHGKVSGRIELARLPIEKAVPCVYTGRRVSSPQ